MKKNKWFGWAFVAAMMGTGFSACTNEAEEVLAQESEIKLTSEITPSRVTNQNFQSTLIVPGRSVGVFIDGAKEPHDNEEWIAGTNGELTHNEPVYWGTGEATITAYHPYNASCDGSEYSFSVSLDQSSDDGYLNSDLLWGKKTSPKTNNPVQLTFCHLLTKINVTLTSDHITDLSNATINICNAKTSCTFNPLNGLVTSENNVAEIKAGITTTEAYTASAIIIPQHIDDNLKFIKVSHNNKTYYYSITIPGGRDFISGCSYTYNLKVNAGKLEEISSNITNWNDEVIGGEMKEEMGNSNAETDLIIIYNTELSTALLAELGAEKVKINSDGYAQMTQNDILAVTELNFGTEEGKYTISSLSGIEHFSNLRTLYCNYTGLTECDLTQNKALQDVVLCGSFLKTLDVSGLTELRYLGCPYSDTLEELIMTNCDKLGHLECMSTKIGSIEFSNPDAVWQLICGGNENLNINLNLYPNLTVLGLREMGLTTIDIPENIRPNLTWLSFENNKIESFDLSDYENLELFDCANNNLTSLDLTPVPNLTFLACGMNSVNFLDITCLPKLETLTCGSQKDNMSQTLKLTEEQKEIWDSTWSKYGDENVSLEVVNN